ncbi:hypothetical protein CVD28_02515 [Bacillus sp. M6-12]|uniref:hypothetical protein n=1 Tax=Bacillus sp. M6-12 TaxID=2054166 RepID=UPI000C76E88F|nr:hypothetical protein [Bacillus sp. M6-12]PLS19305.1 hypothetical protein CVD28_02515 [Bacillus sp. M6-12]
MKRLVLFLMFAFVFTKFETIGTSLVLLALLNADFATDAVFKRLEDTKAKERLSSFVLKMKKISLSKRLKQAKDVTPNNIFTLRNVFVLGFVFGLSVAFLILNHFLG